VLTAASFDPLAGRLRHFPAIIAHRKTPLISAGNATGYFAVVEAVRETARTDARVSPGQILEQVA
jgi:NAD/NADP transhydrogenase alpha subunit